MSYTICYAEDIATGQKVDYSKLGNTYTIYFTNGEVMFSKRYNNRELAQKVYLKVIDFFMSGDYSFNDRVEIIDRMEEV